MLLFGFCGWRIDKWLPWRRGYNGGGLPLDVAPVDHGAHDVHCLVNSYPHIACYRIGLAPLPVGLLMARPTRLDPAPHSLGHSLTSKRQPGLLRQRGVNTQVGAAMKKPDRPPATPTSCVRLPACRPACHPSAMPRPEVQCSCCHAGMGRHTHASAAAGPLPRCWLNHGPSRGGAVPCHHLLEPNDFASSLGSSRQHSPGGEVGTTDFRRGTESRSLVALSATLATPTGPAAAALIIAIPSRGPRDARPSFGCPAASP